MSAVSTSRKSSLKPAAKSALAGSALAFTLASLYASGESGSAIDLTSTSNLFQDAARSTPVTSDSDPVGGVTDQSGNGAHASQSTSTARPLWDATNSRVVFDGADDALNITLPAISGGQIAIITSDGLWVENFDFAGGTFTVGGSNDDYTNDNGAIKSILNVIGLNFYALVIIDRALTAGEITSLLSLYSSCPGQFTLGSDVVVNGTFDAGTDWIKGAGWVVSGGVASGDGANTGSSYLSQDVGDNTMLSGRNYICSVDTSSYSAGRGRINNAGMVSAFIDSNTTSKVAGVASTSAKPQLQLWTTGTVMDWDNFSVKEIIAP